MGVEWGKRSSRSVQPIRSRFWGQLKLGKRGSEEGQETRYQRESLRRGRKVDTGEIKCWMRATAVRRTVVLTSALLFAPLACRSPLVPPNPARRDPPDLRPNPLPSDHSHPLPRSSFSRCRPISSGSSSERRTPTSSSDSLRDPSSRPSPSVVSLPALRSTSLACMLTLRGLLAALELFTGKPRPAPLVQVLRYQRASRRHHPLVRDLWPDHHHQGQGRQPPSRQEGPHLFPTQVWIRPSTRRQGCRLPSCWIQG